MSPVLRRQQHWSSGERNSHREKTGSDDNAYFYGLEDKDWQQQGRGQGHSDDSPDSLESEEEHYGAYSRNNRKDGYSTHYGYRDSEGSSRGNVKSVHHGYQSQGSVSYGQDSRVSSHTDDQDHKVKTGEKESDTAKVHPLHECHYETISLFKPIAAKQTSDLQYSGFERSDTFEGNGYENQGYDDLHDDGRLSHGPDDFTQERYVNVDFSNADEGNFEDDEDDEEKGIFKLSSKEDSSRNPESNADTNEERSVKFQKLYEALQDVNKFIENLPLDDFEHEDENREESIVGIYESKVDDGGNNSEANSRTEAEEKHHGGNTWVRYDFDPSDGNFSKTSGSYREDGHGLRRETTTVVLPYHFAAHMRNRAEESVTPAARVMLAGMELDASFARLVHPSPSCTAISVWCVSTLSYTVLDAACLLV